MNEVHFPIRHTEVPLREASRDPGVVVLLAYVLAPPEHVLTQTDIFPIVPTIYGIDYPQVSMVAVGYHATGFEADSRPVTVAEGKLWFFSQALYDQRVARLRVHGWRPSGRPELVLVAAQAAEGGGWNFGEEPVAIDLVAVADRQPVSAFIGDLLIELHKGPIARTLKGAGRRTRQMIDELSLAYAGVFL